MEPQASEPGRGRWTGLRRWQPLLGLVGIVALALVAAETVQDMREQAVPSMVALGAALVLQTVAMILSAQSWAALFPAESDRSALIRGLYTSQLTKYLPVGGGVAQVASQVALSSKQDGVRAAALRLPVFALCGVVAGLTIGSGLAFDGDLPAWGRALAAGAALSVLALRREILAHLLRVGRRVVGRLPDPDSLPPQRSIFRCYLFALGNMAAFSAAFTVLLSDLTDISPFEAMAASGLGWSLGFLVVLAPAGLGVREAILVAALPGIATGTILAVSVAHRLLGLIAEVGLAGLAHLRAARAGRQVRKLSAGI